MYFNYGGKAGGHNAAGVTSPANEWYLAEGYTAGEFDTYVLVQNPGGEDASVTLEFQLPPGSEADPFELDVPAGTRRTVHLDELPGLSATDVSTRVTADKPVVAERAMYFDYAGKTGGSCSQAYNGLRAPIISPNTKVLTDSTLDLLSSVSKDQETLVFDGRNDEIDSLEEGDVLVARATEKTPYGLLRKVTNTSEAGGGINVTTEQASLVDAICQGDIFYNKPLTADDIVNSEALGEGVTVRPGSGDTGGEGEIYLELRDIVLCEEGDAQVKVNGHISMKPDVDFHAAVGWSPLWHFLRKPELEELSFTVTMDQHAEIELFAGLETELLDERKSVLAPIVFGAIDIQVGPVPVVIVPVLQVYVGANGKVFAGLTTSLTEDANATAGVCYSSGQWSEIAGCSADFGYEEPKLTAGGNVKVFAGPRFMLLIYGVLGPWGEVDAYLEFDIDVCRDPWWQLYGGVEASMGVQFSVLDYILADKEFPLVIGERWPIAQAVPNKIKIVLTWGDTPSDLDSHLTGPLPDGGRFHMYYPYSDTNYGSPWPDVVRLDLDDITSYGPEMTTVLNRAPGVYRFSVHDYTNRDSTYSYDLSYSGATVKLFMGGELEGTYYVPQGADGTTWTVFEINGNNVTTINAMSYDSMFGDITLMGGTRPEK